MKEKLKLEINNMINSLQDENTLQMLMEDVSFYTAHKDVTDDLSPSELNELEEAIKEADNNEVTNWEDFKKRINEWKER